MGYKYEDVRPTLFTDEGQRQFLKVRDRVFHLLKLAGAVRQHEAVCGTGPCDTWKKMACIDRMVELGELREVPQEEGVPGQYRVYVGAGE